MPLPGQSGDLEAPVSQAVDASFPDSVLTDTIICPYNQPEIAQSLLEKHGSEIAAVIVEPVLGSMGMVAAEASFLQVLRDGCDKHGAILIFDEVITLRLTSGGAQKQLGITPDLTCMGKIIGGGLPVGGVGGRRDLMQLFSPEQKNPVMHASTFSGNALTMAAGRAAMERYGEQEAQKLNLLGERLREGFNQAFSQAGIRGQAVGSGSLSNILFSDVTPTHARQSLDAMITGGHITQLLHLGMLRRGIMSATRLMYCTSTAMTEAEVDLAVTALNETLHELRPYIEAERPQLINA